ncbi:MAG: ribose 5-phosphate isomerase A [Clostridia bacterium]|nr:ribose 5-phosphate isomerase A [Clostridia bacterium]
MNWEKEILQNAKWNEDITNKEQKQKLALKIAEKVNDGDVIGFGSGSTSFVAICAIAEKIKKENIKITAIPTSYEIKMLCSYFDIPTCTLQEKKPDWCFDGADEIDNNNWMIKGRGAAMFKEKLNILNASKVYILADESKFVDKLGAKRLVPVECYPEAVNYVKEELLKLGATDVILRLATKKDGPVITECGNFILDTKFENINENLETTIKAIPGVIESRIVYRL